MTTLRYTRRDAPSDRRRRSAHGALAALLVLSATPSSGQLVAIDLRTRHPSYVIGEPVMVRLTVENHGAQPLVIGDHEVFRDNRILFDIRRMGKEALPALRERKIVGELDLEHGEGTTLDIDLAEWYPLLEAGRYYITPVLIHNDRRYAADSRVIEIVPGIELARLTQIIRDRELIERNFILVYWARDGREDVFLRTLDRPGGATWTTLALGPIVRVNRPALQQDGDNAIRVTHQASRDVTIVSRIRSDAEGPVVVEQRQIIDAVSSPMVNTLNEALEKTRQKEPRRRR